MDELGMSCVALCDIPNATFNGFTKRLRPKDDRRVAPEYAGYYFRSPNFRQAVTAMSTMSTRASLNNEMLARLSISLPPIGEQSTIGHFLGTLDDKIEMNRRMNETLEAMARALFKSWFVDFDPVRAKAEGREPGLPKPVADLFPDSFKDSELGEIPRGWEVKPLDEMAHFLNGLALQKYPPIGEQFLPVIKIAQLRAGTIEGADRASADLEPAYVVQNGDILFSWSGSLECVLWAAGPGALNQHLFKVTSDKYPKWLCFLGIPSPPRRLPSHRGRKGDHNGPHPAASSVRCEAGNSLARIAESTGRHLLSYRREQLAPGRRGSHAGFLARLASSQTRVGHNSRAECGGNRTSEASDRGS